VVVRNSTFEGTGQVAIRVEGATTSEISSVLIENCPKIEGSIFGIVVSEVDAPVTIRNCVLTKGGIGMDGDIEGEGRTGSINKPYVVGPSVTVQAPVGVGLSAQDLKNVTVTNCTINGTVSVSSGRMTMTGSTINTAQAITVDKGPDGTPGVLHASGNTISGVALVGTKGFAALGGNTWSGFASVADANPGGGLMNDPVGGGLSPERVGSKVDFNGNGCADYPVTPDKNPNTGDCENGPGVPPPPDPG
jgi:hypothetical protein